MGIGRACNASDFNAWISALMSSVACSRSCVEHSCTKDAQY